MTGTRRNGSTSTSASAVQPPRARRSEEHTSELQSQSNLVCRLLLEKKKTAIHIVSANTNHDIVMMSGLCEIYVTYMPGTTMFCRNVLYLRMWITRIP